MFASQGQTQQYYLYRSCINIPNRKARSSRCPTSFGAAHSCSFASARKRLIGVYLGKATVPLHILLANERVVTKIAFKLSGPQFLANSCQASTHHQKTNSRFWPKNECHISPLPRMKFCQTKCAYLHEHLSPT